MGLSMSAKIHTDADTKMMKCDLKTIVLFAKPNPTEKSLHSGMWALLILSRSEPLENFFSKNTRIRW